MNLPTLWGVSRNTNDAEVHLSENWFKQDRGITQDDFFWGVVWVTKIKINSHDHNQSVLEKVLFLSLPSKECWLSDF